MRPFVVLAAASLAARADAFVPPSPFTLRYYPPAAVLVGGVPAADLPGAGNVTFASPHAERMRPGEPVYVVATSEIAVESVEFLRARSLNSEYWQGLVGTLDYRGTDSKGRRIYTKALIAPAIEGLFTLTIVTKGNEQSMPQRARRMSAELDVTCSNGIYCDGQERLIDGECMPAHPATLPCIYGTGDCFKHECIEAARTCSQAPIAVQLGGPSACVACEALPFARGFAASVGANVVGEKPAPIDGTCEFPKPLFGARSAERGEETYVVRFNDEASLGEVSKLTAANAPSSPTQVPVEGIRMRVVQKTTDGFGDAVRPVCSGAPASQLARRALMPPPPRRTRPIPLTAPFCFPPPLPPPPPRPLVALDQSLLARPLVAGGDGVRDVLYEFEIVAPDGQGFEVMMLGYDDSQPNSFPVGERDTLVAIHEGAADGCKPHPIEEPIDELCSDDSSLPGGTGSRVHGALKPGVYTIVASFFTDRLAGSYQLLIMFTDATSGLVRPVCNDRFCGTSSAQVDGVQAECGLFPYIGMSACADADSSTICVAGRCSRCAPEYVASPEYVSTCNAKTCGTDACGQSCGELDGGCPTLDTPFNASVCDFLIGTCKTVPKCDNLAPICPTPPGPRQGWWCGSDCKWHRRLEKLVDLTASTELEITASIAFNTRDFFLGSCPIAEGCIGVPPAVGPDTNFQRKLMRFATWVRAATNARALTRGERTRALLPSALLTRARVHTLVYVP